MIVLDEQISNDLRIAQIAAWYPGAVVSIRDQRPHGVILDPEIPSLLLQLRQPTFVTINYRHFWGKRFLHADYCIVCLKLSQEESGRVSDVLRAVLHNPQFRAKRQRLGKVISWTETQLSHWEL